MKQTILVPSIHDNDLSKILKKYEMLEDFLNGKLFCIQCDKSLSWINLGGMYYLEQKINLVCDNDDCVDLLITSRNG